jgi:inner membrane protein involved in colicin E2 resistance
MYFSRKIDWYNLNIAENKEEEETPNNISNN